MNGPGRPRSALCGNVFSAAHAEEVLAALADPVRRWSQGLQQRGWEGPLGFGLYLSAQAARQFARDYELRQRLKDALRQADVHCWTANAFPFGDFHSGQVKEQAFLPDWSSSERLRYTEDVAKVLLDLAPESEETLSISTCPLGYGPRALDDPMVRDHLRQVAESFAECSQQSGRRLVLALEPEPDGACETVASICSWLEQHFEASLLAHLGLCWDLCHSAVVGESAQSVAESLHTGLVPLAKVQVSVALARQAPLDAVARDRLQRLTDDGYLHQVRGESPQGPFRYPDTPDFLASGHAQTAQSLRVHCHVPIHRQDFGGGFEGTPWQEALAVAWGLGARAFELETYTLGALPKDLLERADPVSTMVAEMEALNSSLRALDTPPR